MAGPDQRLTGVADTIYGEGILADEIDRLRRVIVVTSRTPWALHAARLRRAPVAVVMPGTLERATLDEMGATLPPAADIVGLGGGAVIDAAKYFARGRGGGVTLVPTVSTSNGPFSEWISVRRDGRPNGFRDPALPRRVIVDYRLIATADPRVNRAGYGDLLPLLTTLNDWRLAAAAGRGKPVDPGVEATAADLMRQAIAAAGEIGSLSHRGIERLMRLTAATTALMSQHPDLPINAGSEHLFAWTLEIATGRHFLHGEIVALGIVIASYLQGRDHDRLVRALDEARVTWRPAHLGLAWPEIEQTLRGIAAYNRDVRQYHTVFDDVAWSPRRLADVREVVDRPRPTS